MADDWYYSSGEKKSGPTSSSKLKRLAVDGSILPTDLVWKEGMAQWIVANTVKGLFASAAPASFAPPPPPPPGSPASTPSPSSSWHPLDTLVDAARLAVPVNLAERISTLAGNVGIYALYGAAVLVPVGGLIAAIRADRIGTAFSAFGAGLAVVVAQYVAFRLLGAVGTAIAANKTTLSSLAVPDVNFVLLVAGSIAGFVGLLIASIQTSEWMFLIGALASLAVGSFAAVVALTPSGMSVEVDTNCPAAQDAVGVVSFLFKLILRCAPLAFAASVFYAMFQFTDALFRLLTTTGTKSAVAASDGVGAVTQLFAAALIPLYAYFLMLLYYISLDIISAIVSIPGKLDALAAKDGTNSN